MRLIRFTITFVCLLLFCHVNAQLSADFTANTQEGCDFETINFTNISTDGGSNINCLPGYSYNWDFSPGNSTQCSPGNIFSTPGTYTICLTITNDNTGENDTECKTDFIIIHPLPVPSFTFTPQTGCEPLEVCFQNTTTLQSGNLTNCIWDFGDGQVLDDCSTGQICHTYAQDGNYTATLTVLDDNGCPAVTATNIISVISAAEINIIADQTFSCAPPLTVNFINISSTTNNVTFDWSFEGGNPTSFQGETPPPVTWSTEGAFDVTITSINPTGCTDTLILDDYIVIGSSIDFAPSTYNVCLGDTVFFNDLSGGTPFTWNWDFGDGMGTSTLQNPFHIYTTPGCFPVSLTVDNGGCNATITDPICIDVNDTPDISFTNDNPIGCEIPHTVSFTPAGTVANGTFNWIFGVDTIGTSNSPSPTFTFTEFGNYPVSLEYFSPEGCRDTFADVIIVEEIVVLLQGSSVEGCVPITVNLQENSTSVSPINDWVWTIPGIGTFNEQSPTVMATDTGEYDVILQVTNDLGCIAIDTFEAYIQTGVPQMVEFSADPLLTCIDTSIQFTDMSSPFVDQWFWQFGDGPTSFSFAQNPEHEYIDTGYFEVCLTVFQNGCENTICKPDYVYLLPPRAGINFTLDCNDPYTYAFEENTIGADSIIWDFGVPNTNTDVTNDLNPTFTFPTTGSYLTSQIVYNFDTGCTDTAFQQIIVADPLADFTLPDTIGCVPLIITPLDASVDAVLWEWTSFGGGIVADGNTPFPTILYETAGLYTDDIQLVITDVNGCTDTFVTTQEIYVNDIFVDFIISDPTGCAPFTVTLTDNSTNLFGNNIQYDWTNLQGTNYIDGGPQIEFTFPTADTFDIRLWVFDDLGCDRRLRINDTIIVTNPIALFNSDTFACAEQVISFNNLSVGESLTYAWDFGDTNTSIAENPTHFYTAEGMYDVCLTITDSNGCDSIFCRTITVADPIADFVADTTFAFCPPLVVSFANLSQNAVPGGNIWDFGDGTGLSFGDSPSHVYTQAGTFDVTLITTSESGCQDTIVFDDYIELQGPIGSFSFSPDNGCAPVTVTFITTSVLPSLHIMDYGDGSIDSSAMAVTVDTFVYTYSQAGNYVPALILVDDLGCDQVFDSDSTIVVETLSIDFLASDTLLCDGGITNFTSNISSSTPITFLEWTFEGQTPPTSNDPNPVNYIYNNNGQYDVTLEVSNGVCSETLVQPDYITVEAAPIAGFTAAPMNGCEGLDVNFTDASTVASGAITQWDWDFGDTNSSTDQNTMHTYNVAGNYTVNLTVSTVNGCTDNTSQPIDIFSSPVIEASPASSICIGESVPLSAQLLTDPTGINLVWDNAGSLSCTNCLAPIANPIVTTTYTITATSPNGCTDAASVTVEVALFPVPNINLNADTSICEGTTIQLIANGGTADPASYQWDQSSTGLSCYACPNPFADPLTTTTYTVTVTGPGGCVAIDDVVVSVFDPSQTFAGPDVTICEGESINLSDGNFGSNPSWSPQTDLSCQFCANPLASPSVTTTYGITVDDPVAGCPITDSVTVTVIPLGSIDAGEDNTICSGDPVQLNGSGTGSLIWSPGNVLTEPTIANPIATITQNTTFTLTATNGNCILQDSVTITVTDSIVIVANDQDICFGDSVQLFATGGNAESYIWTPETGLSNPNIANPVAHVDETTTYNVSASFGSCPSNVAEVTVTVNPLPEASILPIHNFYPGDAIQLFIEQEQANGYAYSWLPTDGLSCDDCQTPVAAPDTNTVYAILVTDLVTACEVILFTELRELGACIDDVLAVPNAFTPNNDGVNDVLYVRSTAVGNINMFRVFDRWGAMMFETTDISIGWDGTYGGKRVNPGVFVYYVEAYCPLDGSIILKKGNVTVLK